MTEQQEDGEQRIVLFALHRCCTHHDGGHLDVHR